MVKLTGVPHPDMNDGKRLPLYVDAERVIYIERSSVQHIDMAKEEAWRQMLSSLWDETGRVADVVKGIRLEVINLDHENSSIMRQWTTIASAAEDLKVAYTMINGVKGPFTHPRHPCTTIGLAYGTANGDLIALIQVSESPEEAARLLAP